MQAAASLRAGAAGALTARSAAAPQRCRSAPSASARRQGRKQPRALGSSGQDGAADSGGGDDGGTPPSDEVQELLRLRAQAARLNELFFSPAAAGVSDLEASLEQPDDAEDASGGGSSSSGLRVRNLPLWRVQWAALPGTQEVLHVHVPHYTSMFERLLRTPKPWRYGSLYLPEGSKNLDNPEFALEPGTKAPLAGTLMEVLQAVRFADGRLLVLAVGVGRFRVTRATQSSPYWRSDVALLLDAEEQQQFEPLALQALESVQGGLEGSSSEPSSSGSGGGGGGGGEASSSSGSSSSGIPLTALMAAVPAAARAAAAASSTAWLEYELSDVRQDCSAGEDSGRPAVIDGSNPTEAQRMGRRLAAIAGNEVLEQPFFPPLQAAAQAAAAPGIRDVLEEGSDPASILQAALDAQRPVLRQTDASAHALAISAAAREITERVALPSSSGEGSDRQGQPGSGEAAAAPAWLNTAAEREVEVQAAAEVLGEDALEGKPDSLGLALQLEQLVWAELDAISTLANKLREREQPLPSGMQSLRPMAAGSGGGSPSAAAAAAATGAAAGPAAAAGEGAAAALQAGAHPDWPALRRVQHLSFAVTSQLANVSAAEGRQAFVEAPSVCARLRLGLAALRKHRQVLAAVVAVEGL